MRFHPVVSIFFGFLVFLLLFGSSFYLALDDLISVSSFIVVLVISFIISGFIATYFARERKIRYSLYELIPVFIVLFFLNQFISGLLALLFIPLGGRFGLIDKKSSGFSPLLAITGGSVIGFTGLMLITIIIGFNINTNYYLKVIVFVLGAVSFAVGGFLSTFLAKEKKLQYGIYTGIIIVILSIAGYQTSIYNPPIIRIIAIALYIFFAVIGSYIAIKITKHKKNLNNESIEG